MQYDTCYRFSQKAGHYLDSVAAGIDTALEEEELLADQLKEYLFSAGALQTVCRRQEILQYQVERAQDLVQQQVLKLERVQQGNNNKNSLTSKFSSV